MKRWVTLFAVVLSVMCLRAAFVQQPLPQDGPWNRDLDLLESPDGLRFGQARLFVERGGVPTVVRDGKGRLIAAFQWFPFERREAFDRVAVKVSNDDGKTWSDPQPIVVIGMPTGYQRPFDPTLAALDDGRIRIYFTSSPGAPSPNQQTQIYSAISSDGVRYAFESGVRFGVEGGRAFDCSVVRIAKTWHYFSPIPGRDGCAFHAVSEDGLRFTRLPDIALPIRGSWIGNPVALKDGVRFYGSGAGGWSAFSRDGSTWQVDSNTRFVGGDPAVVQRRDGSFLMIVTGGPRADRALFPSPTLPRDTAQPMAGPYAHKVLSATSPDGLRWTRDEDVRMEHASVPCAVADGDRILLYYVDADRGPGKPESVGCAVSRDGIHFEKQPLSIEGLPTFKAIDPSVMKDADGKFRLYYFASNAGGDPAGQSEQHEIHLALSDDGIRFKEASVVFRHPHLVDPDVFFYKGTWFMYVYGEGRTVIATSQDGRDFTYKQALEWPGYGTVAPVLLDDGRLRLYAFEQRKPNGNEVHSFISTDGLHWTREEGFRLRAEPGEQITDPFVIRWKGGYKMFFKSEQRGSGAEGDGAPPPVPSVPSAMAAGKDFIYVVRDGVLYQYDAKTLELVRQTRLPESSGAPVGFNPQNDGPHNHRVLRAASKDGLTWKSDGKVIVEPASVPDAVVGHDGRTRIYFVDPRSGGISVGIEGADGKWTFQRTNLRGADPNVLLLKSGRYRAFTKEGVQRGTIVYAESEDGVNFTPPQVAFYDERFPHVTDADVFETPTGWVMYVSLGPRLLLAESKDGLKFAAVRTVDLSGSVCDTIAMDGGYRLFFHVNPTPTQPMHIRSAFSRDGRHWTVEGARLMPTPNSPDVLGVGDPAVIRLKDGTYRMFYKSFIRSFGDGQPPGGVRDLRPSGDTSPPPAPPARREESTPPSLRGRLGEGSIQVQRVNSTYRVARGGNSGFFKTGQNADIMLSGVDFDNTGGGLLFNHPSSIASDGTHLLLADTNNNRVLIWNKLPTSNVPPDVVIGQTNLTRNTPGAGRNQLNWCIGVAASSDGRVAVADTYNDRILLWNRVPTQSTTPADVELQLPVIARQAGYGNFGWPWGVWTNGKMLMATATHGSAVLLWKTFPTRDNQPPDLILRNPAFGTPRSITSDGKSLIVDDHNARVSRNGQGTFFYKTLPTDSEQPHDFFVDGLRMQGDFTRDGKLLLLSDVALYLFHSFPQSANAQPDLWLRGTSERGGFGGGDGADVVVAGGRVAVALGNENKILVYNSVPTSRDQLPDFAIGAPDVYTNTLRTNFFITNPVPASNGKSLFVSSDFDAKLYVYKNLPDESGAKPDLVYHLPDAPWDNALRGDTLALAGKQTVFVWMKPPLNGEMPDRVFRGGIGSVRFQELSGVALDDKYFYLSDGRAGMIYVWKGLPTQNDEPLFALSAGEAVGRLSSDGTYLAAVSGFGPGGAVMIYRVADLRQGAQPAAVLRGFNLPGGVLVANGHLFVGDTCFGRVVIWSKTEDALSGKPPDVLLGKESFSDFSQQIGRNKLFWPCALSFDGEYLWVGEFKFSGRILRFSPTSKGSIR
jgi:hypothetical protein